MIDQLLIFVSRYMMILTGKIPEITSLQLTLSSLKTATAVERIFPFIPENL